jgi:hypothetical protein
MKNECYEYRKNSKKRQRDETGKIERALMKGTDRQIPDGIY